MKISEELANETTQRNLTREQKEAVGLLSIGTFYNGTQKLDC
jgi:hypothetical protein